MTKEQLERVKQMMVSENTDDINLAGQVIRSLFKDEESFKQFIDLMNTQSLYPMEEILTSNVVNPYSEHEILFTNRLMVKDINRCGELKITIDESTRTR